MHHQPKRGFLRRHLLAASLLVLVIGTAFYQLQLRRHWLGGCCHLSVNQGNVFLSILPKRPFLSVEQLEFEFQTSPHLGTLPRLSISPESLEVSSPLWLLGLLIIAAGALFEYRHRRGSAARK
jgi:hypothetical protein